MLSYFLRVGELKNEQKKNQQQYEQQQQSNNIVNTGWTERNMDSLWGLLKEMILQSSPFNNSY